MLQAAIIQLRDKLRPEVVTDPLQIDPAMDAASLTTYLNSILSTTTDYVLYYGSARVTDTVQKIIDTHGLGEEDTIVIDYMDVSDQKEDLSISCEDVVVDLAFLNARLYARFYNGAFTEVGADGCIMPGVKQIAAQESVYGVCEKGVVNLLTKEAVGTYSSAVHQIATHGSRVAVAVTKKNIHIVAGEKTEDIFAEDAVRCMLLTEKALLWVESLDAVNVYDLVTKKRSVFFTKHTITALAADNDTIYCATSEGALLTIENKVVEVHAIGVQMVDRLILTENVLILLSQYSAVVLSRVGLAEKTCLFFNEQANAIAVEEDKLYVALGQKISGFLMSRFE